MKVFSTLKHKAISYGVAASSLAVLGVTVVGAGSPVNAASIQSSGNQSASASNSSNNSNNNGRSGQQSSSSTTSASYDESTKLAYEHEISARYMTSNQQQSSFNDFMNSMMNNQNNKNANQNFVFDQNDDWMNGGW